MLPTSSWQFDNHSSKKNKSLLTYLALAIMSISACANITIQPKDPELLALGKFADQATLHLFEVNPSTYTQYQEALEQEIAPNILSQLKARGSAAKSKEQAKEFSQIIENTHQRCLIKIDSTTFPQKATVQGLIPIEVQGTVVKTANDISKSSEFKILYLVGTSPTSKKPMVASIQVKKFD